MNFIQINEYTWINLDLIEAIGIYRVNNKYTIRRSEKKSWF